MPDRSRHWLRQAERDLAHAEASRAAGHHEWACFAAQQAAEKAVKALHLSLKVDVWGHVVRQLLEDLPASCGVGEELFDRARALDGHYIGARYANGHADGAPLDHYGDLQSREAIDHARAILDFAGAQMAGA